MILLNPFPIFGKEKMTLLTLRKQNIALATFLVDKPRKYKYNARSIYDEDVLFLVLDILEIGHL